jgi:O-antigen/teichoic acid export membrane protein
MIKDKFIRGSALLFAAMMVGNVFGYFFQLAMGRMLTVEAYGEMNALMSLMILFGLPFSTLLNFFARQTAIYFSTDKLTKIKGLHRFGTIRTYVIMGPIICLLGLFSPLIADYLEVPFDMVLAILLCVFITAMITLNTGIIQGMQYFRSLSVISAGTSILKFAFSVMFVWFGWGVRGALGGLLATGLVVWIGSQRLIQSSLPETNKNFILSFNGVYKYVGGLFLANSFFAVMTQADVILIKHYFSAQNAGLYASAAIVGKAVMYLPGAIVMALFPMVATSHEAGQSSWKILSKALIITIALSGSGAIVLFAFPEYVMGVLFGERYLSAAPIVALFGFAMLPMALVLLTMNFSLAQGKTKCVYFLAIAVIIEIAGIHFFRGNLKNILYVIMTTGCITLSSMAIYLIKQFIACDGIKRIFIGFSRTAKEIKNEHSL